jgi:hypothetical protein
MPEGSINRSPLIADPLEIEWLITKGYETFLGTGLIG